jgi:hypothetical protein
MKNVSVRQEEMFKIGLSNDDSIRWSAKKE